MKNPFFNKSYIAIDQINDKSQVEYLFAHADKMKQVIEKGQVYEPLGV